MRESLSGNNYEQTPQSFGIETYYTDLVDSYFSTLLSDHPESSEDLIPLLEQIQHSLDGNQKIKSIQYKLKVLEGYDLGPYKNSGIDGDPGKMTRKAIYAYLQKLSVLGEYQDEQQHTLDETRYKLTDLQAHFTRTATHEKIVERADMVDLLVHAYTAQQTQSSMHLSFLTDHDIKGLVYLETLFMNAPTNKVGSTGLMQLTSWPYKQMQKTPDQFDMSYIRQKFREYGYDFDQVHSSKSLRLEAYMNPQINSLMGIAYLYRCEHASTPYQSRIQKITSNHHIAKKAIKHELTKRDVVYTDSQIDELFTRLANDPNLQQKYMAYVRYNGDNQDRHGHGIPFKYIYASTILFLGSYIF